MTEKQNSKKRSSWFYVLFCVSILLVVFVAAYTIYAAYLAYAQPQKRTISTWQDTSNYFNSNYMGSLNYGADVSTYPSVVVARGEGNMTLSVLVCNYNRMDDSIFSDHNISYDFKVTICDANREAYTETITYSNFKVAYNSNTYNLSSNSYTIQNQTLTGGAPDYHLYKVTFPSDFEDYIRIEAIPTDPAETDNIQLGCYITSSLLDRKMARDWSGQWTGLENVTDPTTVEGFNFEISGSGDSQYKLSWNSEKIDISQWFLEDYDLDVTYRADGWNSVTLDLPLNATDDLFHTYLIQFYRMSKASLTEDMEVWNSWIKFEKVESLG